MTIASENKRNDYTGNNSTDTYAYSFKVLSKTDLKVVKRDTDDVETLLTVDTDYTVSGVGDTAGGSITLTAGNLPEDYHLTIRRVRPITQETDIRNQGDFFPEIHEDALDSLCMINQAQQEEIDRTIKIPETVTGVSTVLPMPVAGKPFGWNANANGIVNMEGVPVTANFLQGHNSTGTHKAWIDMKEAGCVGDGVTSDQTAVAAAIASAYSAGVYCYWPDGTYLTTASIPNFHDVRHYGPGVVKRGSTLFYVQPNNGVTNNLYVATTGSATNDGLSSSEPLATIQAAGNKIYNYLYGDCTWVVQLAAGTYTETVSFSKPFPTPNRVQFKGPAVADGTTPTAIIDSPGGSNKVGLYFQNHIRAYSEDIKFTDFADSGTPSVSGGSSGITADTGCELYTRNIHTTNCDVGIEAASETKLRVQAGIHDADAVGIRCISNVTYTIGYGGSAASVAGDTGTAILNCTVAGVFAQEGANGHVDYSWIDNCAIGVDIIERSRTHLLGSRIGNCATGVRGRVLSALYDNPVTTNTFTTNTDNFLFKSGSVRITEEQDSFNPGFLSLDTAGGNTQSATPVTVYTKAFVAGELAVRGAGFRLKIQGDVVGTADTKNVTITLGATTLLNRTITASTTDYYIEVEFFNRTASGSPVQKYVTKVFENGVTPVITVASATEDLSAAKTLTVTHNVANVADRNDIELVELQVIH